jgi:hypothetical protein
VICVYSFNRDFPYNLSSADVNILLNGEQYCVDFLVIQSYACVDFMWGQTRIFVYIFISVQFKSLEYNALNCWIINE